MSTVIRSCPGCKSLILSDTDQCPECGHVFYERRKTESSGVAPATPDTLKSASIHEPCPHCGEMVRSGLVRCWSCNGFMRADVAARYRDLTTKPQPIIYSTISPENRNEFLPARADASDFVNHKVLDSEDFQLGSGRQTTPAAAVPVPAPDFEIDGGFALSDADTVSKAPGSARARAAAEAGNKPSTKAKEKEKVAAAETAGDKAEAAPVADAPAAKPAGGGSSRAARDDQDLFSFAVEEQKEVKKRRGQKTAERLRKQILVPCSCGAWIRVNDDQAGKSVRCKQCKQAVVVPGLRKKSEKPDAKASEKTVKGQASGSQKRVAWLDDVWYHVLSPATLVLKPGSLTGKHVDVDVAMTESGLQVLTFSGTVKKKRSLFSFISSGKKGDHQLRRKQIHEQVASSGDFKSLENVEMRTVEADHISDIRLVQPVAKVSESMFAGVPVFGEGRIAMFLPVVLDEGKQAFLSFTLSGWRAFSAHLKALFGFELAGTENGIPEGDQTETLSCFVNQAKVESIKGLLYYQKDVAYQLELTGYKCKSCGTAISEEGRKKTKLGGVKGKSIAKAKCPKCSNKMQAEMIYKIAKAPELPAVAETQ